MAEVRGTRVVATFFTGATSRAGAGFFAAVVFFGAAFFAATCFAVTFFAATLEAFFSLFAVRFFSSDLAAFSSFFFESGFFFESFCATRTPLAWREVFRAFAPLSRNSFHERRISFGSCAKWLA